MKSKLFGEEKGRYHMLLHLLAAEEAIPDGGDDLLAELFSRANCYSFDHTLKNLFLSLLLIMTTLITTAILNNQINLTQKKNLQRFFITFQRGAELFWGLTADICPLALSPAFVKITLFWGGG